MSDPLVSIVIPCYNRERYITDALNSALNQTYSNIEIIVVDDGSTDKTLEVLSGYADKIQIISQTNKGVSAARNAGFYASKGDYVVFLDSDDWMSDDLVEKHVQTAKIFPEVDIYCSDNRGIDGQGNLSEIARTTYPDQPDTPLELFLLKPPPFPACEMYKASTVRQLGCYDESMKSFADSVLRLNIILAGGKVVRTQGGYAVYRPVANSITKTGKLHASAIRLIKKLQKHPAVIDDPTKQELIKNRLLRHRMRRWKNVFSYHLSFKPTSILKLIYHLFTTSKMDPGYMVFILRDQPWKRSADEVF
ncbi:family 2 glycosyl transferase [Methylophaga lonarensis MPL]|uniref:Family 2 glycosyl transferase n=1 Tax=Methylophaga lonarensis MPL TaxID=1286106 RepID=M7P4A6_9GAMM|nr:glycosyltransferase [Methylophaga lonarensis]EMR14352.1 family 2 glycosyl transferase [Methylophaga lonarensis MPL]